MLTREQIMENDIIDLPSGRSVYANCGYIGISHDLSLSTGYDDRIWIQRGPDDPPFEALTIAEIAELCDVAIARWSALKSKMLAENGGGHE
jgi:hypothetical protein